VADRTTAGLVSGEPTCFVRDDGVGSDPTFAGKMFQPFQRLHKTTEFEGTGIGLAIVSRIVRRHDGRIWADSAPDRGATFFFTLPATGRWTGG
jgi:light-regulated signal transduction histidine kinase (bacteriophytochrome)